MVNFVNLQRQQGVVEEEEDEEEKLVEMMPCHAMPCPPRCAALRMPCWKCKNTLPPEELNG
jgi:hypothetical protein